jgi:hypothetical protein
LAACGATSDSRGTVQALASWAATGEMITQAWVGGAVSRRYGLRALDRVRQTVAARATRLEPLPPEARSRVAASARRLDQTAVDAARAIASGRRDSAGEAAHRFRVEADELGAQASQLTGRP